MSNIPNPPPPNGGGFFGFLRIPLPARFRPKLPGRKGRAGYYNRQSGEQLTEYQYRQYRKQLSDEQRREETRLARQYQTSLNKRYRDLPSSSNPWLRETAYYHWLEKHTPIGPDKDAIVQEWHEGLPIPGPGEPGRYAYSLVMAGVRDPYATNDVGRYPKPN